MYIDLDSLEDEVKPQINSIGPKLELAYTSLISIKFPEDFSYRNRLINMSQPITDTANKIDSIRNWLNLSIDEFNAAESKNNGVIDFFTQVGATGSNILISGVKGIGMLGEGIFDTIYVAATGVSSALTGLWDGGSYLWAFATGNTEEWYSLTAGMWDKTMSFVAEEHVENLYQSFYDTEYGEMLDENAVGIFKSDGIGAEIISGLTYVAGIVALTIATCGIGTAATGATTVSSTTVSSVIAGTAGTGKATEEFWGEMRDSSWVGVERMYERGEISQEDFNTFVAIRDLSDKEWNEVKNDYVQGNIRKEEFETMKQIRQMPEDWTTFENAIKGLAYGSATGVWEGVQWYVGGKLNGWTLKGGSKFATSAIRVTVDTGFNALDTPYRAGLDVLYKGKTYEEAWKDQGGWQDLVANMSVGLVGSVGGEIFDGVKVNKNIKEPGPTKIKSIDDLDDFLGEDMIWDKELTLEQKNFLGEQINRYNEIKNKEMKRVGFKTDSGGKIILDEGTLLHGTIFDETKLKAIKENGIIGAEFHGGFEDGETFYCADFFRVQETMKMNEYFEFCREPEYFGNMKISKGEANYLPARRQSGIAFIINPSKDIDDLLGMDVYRDNIYTEDMKGIVNFDAINNDQMYGIKDRLAAPLYGVPENAISGIWVGDDVKLDIDKIRFLEEQFPDLYIIDKEGTIIYNPQLRGNEAINVSEYLNNLEYYSANGISIEEFFYNNGIALTQTDTKLVASDFYGDCKLYMFETAEDILKNGNLSSVERIELVDVLVKYKNMRLANIDAISMANDLRTYFSEDQIQHVINLANNGMADTKKLTDEQLAAIFNYTACGGLEINAWLNDTNLPYSNVRARSRYRNVGGIQDAISGFRDNRYYTTAEGDIMQDLDSVIATSNYDSAIVTYRGVKELYDLDAKLDCSKLKIGDSFRSSGYQSSSVVFENCYGYKNADTNIILKIIVPPNSGTAAYIENVSGVTNYGQMEMLIKRDANLTVVGDLEYVDVNGIMKTIIPVVVQ